MSMKLVGRSQTCIKDIFTISGVLEAAVTCDIAPTCENNGSSSHAGVFGRRDGLSGWIRRVVGWCLLSHKAELFIRK